MTRPVPNPAPPPPVSMSVLGSSLLVTTYRGLSALCQTWARERTVQAIDFANTQTVTMCRHDPEFRQAYGFFDHVAPDGMPLVWCLNRAGAEMSDRVYGPTFMRTFLDSVPPDFTHYLLGGSAECGERLKTAFAKSNPGIRFVGSYHGRCSPDGRLEPSEENAVIDEINRLSPDFVWIGFGTPKQQAWVRHYKASIHRGVLLTVGFGFDVNAGMKKDQPLWMQKLGLGWVFRLAAEPRRLLGRYLKYNTLFLCYLFIDGIRGRAWGRSIREAVGSGASSDRPDPA